MLFNSIEFPIFLIIVFILYWFVIIWNLKVHNALLLFASYVFYEWWDWRFLSKYNLFIDGSHPNNEVAHLFSEITVRLIDKRNEFVCPER